MVRVRGKELNVQIQMVLMALVERQDVKDRKSVHKALVQREKACEGARSWCSQAVQKEVMVSGNSTAGNGASRP